MEKSICKLLQTAPAAEASESGAAPAAATEQPAAPVTGSKTETTAKTVILWMILLYDSSLPHLRISRTNTSRSNHHIALESILTLSTSYFSISPPSSFIPFAQQFVSCLINVLTLIPHIAFDFEMAAQGTCM